MHTIYKLRTMQGGWVKIKKKCPVFDWLRSKSEDGTDIGGINRIPSWEDVELNPYSLWV